MADIDPCAPGSGAQHTIQVLEQLAGAERVRSVMASLPAKDRAEWEASTALAWMPLRLTSAIVDAVAQSLGEDEDDFAERVTREVSRRTLSTIYRAVMRFTWDDALIARASMMYSRIRNVGRMDARMVGTGTAEAIVSGWPGMTMRQARIVGASVAVMLEAAGRKSVLVRTQLAGDGAVYRCTWSPPD